MGLLTGEVALVTGASLGIGRATAVRLAAEGANVVLNYYGPADRQYGKAGAIDVAVAAVAKHGVSAHPYEADIADHGAVVAMVNAAEAKFGHIDILVNNAATNLLEGTNFLDVPEQGYDRVLAVNLKGQFFVTQAVAAGMVKRKHGRIVNISSEVALIGGRGISAYCAAKAGLVGLTKALAKELAPHGITVNCLCPGPIDTDMLQAHERTEPYIQGIPLRRLGRPEEIGAAVVYLVTPDSSWTTGQTFSQNGGIVI